MGVFLIQCCYDYCLDPISQSVRVIKALQSVTPGLNMVRKSVGITTGIGVERGPECHFQEVLLYL